MADTKVDIEYRVIIDTSFDLIKLHDELKEKLKKYVRGTRRKLNDKLKHMGVSAKGAPTRGIVSVRAGEINNKLSLLKNCYRDFKKETGLFIERYNEENAEISVLDTDFNENMLGSTKQYIDIIERYFNIVVENRIVGDVSPISCRRCKVTLTCNDSYCYNCHTVAEISKKSGKCYASSTPSSIPDSDYTNFKKFMETVNCFQGKQKIGDVTLVIEDLNRYFAQNNGPTSKIAENLVFEDIDINVKFEHALLIKKDTSLSIMIEALGKTGHSSHYKNAHYLASKIWFWKLCDLDGVMDLIVEHYLRTQAHYSSAKGEKSSSLNACYRLLKQLEIIFKLKQFSWRCRRQHLKISRQDELIDSNDEIWKKMVIPAGLPFIKTSY